MPGVEQKPLSMTVRSPVVAPYIVVSGRRDGHGRRKGGGRDGAVDCRRRCGDRRLGHCPVGGEAVVSAVAAWAAIDALVTSVRNALAVVVGPDRPARLCLWRPLANSSVADEV